MIGFVLCWQLPNCTFRTIWRSTNKTYFNGWLRYMRSPKGRHPLSRFVGSYQVGCRISTSATVNGGVQLSRLTQNFVAAPQHHSRGWKWSYRFYVVAAVFAVLVVIALWWRKRFLVRKRFVRKRPSVIDISPAIATFYDTRSSLWETLWGEHMHHGYYGEAGNEKKDRIRAQEDMIEELWKFAELDDLLSKSSVVRVLDVGCGIGGAARYLAKKYQSIHVTGITLSKAQVERGNLLTKEQDLEGRVELIMADAHHIPFSDHSFDIVWSLESGEHMADKYLFLSELCRVLKPDGKLAMLVWCHRKCPPPLSDEERAILYSIYEAYRLPYICSLEELSNVALKVGISRLHEADWSASAFPFWIQVLQTAFSMKAIAELRNAGWDTVRSVFAIRHMLQALQRELLVLGALSGTKKLSNEQLIGNK
ncbi:hypothetical protein GpartN1_g1582.t1 [Galdieria partita]|uniref:Methyltransferase type 11 domain-containing protein n=1 Tax=Galdieria partita TaxID=83374 RepID=A0A9C7UNS1_9RHOD|nr:hypothetical protein GpartN1_g1582.t1 [Galdieria partita]